MIKLILVIAFLGVSAANAQNPSQTGRTEFATIEKEHYQFAVDTTKFKAEVTESIISNAKELVFNKIQILHQPILGTATDSIYFVQITSAAKKLTINRPLVRKAQKLYLVDNTTFHGAFGMTYQLCQQRENNTDLCEANVFSIDGTIVFGCGTDPKCAAPGTELPCKSFKAVVFPTD